MVAMMTAESIEIPATYEGLRAAYLDLQQRYTLIHQDYLYVRNQLDFYQRWRKQEDRVPSEVLSSGHKSTVAAIYEMIYTKQVEPNADGYYPIEPWQAAEASGQAIGTVRSHINYVSDVHEDGKPDKLAAVPLFAKRLVKIPNEGGDGFTEKTYLKPLETLAYPLDYDDVARTTRNIGGAGRNQGRKKKCHCGADLEEKVRIIQQQPYEVCRRGHLIAHPVQTVNDPLEVTEETENQVDFEISNQVDTVISYSLPTQVDCEVEVPVTEYPDTPPADPIALSGDPQEIEPQAAALLVEIAAPGPKPEHIEMVGKPDLKYVTRPGRLTQDDCLEHLRGTKTTGATLQHPFGMTRALCFDEDTPEGFQRLKDAAQLLAIPGFLPIIEPSPVPAGDDHAGGGHLWIIFQRLVDAYSARMTVYQYTGSLLQQGKEYWPRPENNRVRLPGGKYMKKPGFEAWCHLYDENGNELSSDGATAARVLLERQTPDSLVNDYAKPAPALVLESQRIERPQPREVSGKEDVKDLVLAEFERQYSWADIANLCGGFKGGKFCAIWRGEKKPSVGVKDNLAKDFSTNAWSTNRMDRYDVWCHVQARENWQEFKKRDLDERCRQFREQQKGEAVA